MQTQQKNQDPNQVFNVAKRIQEIFGELLKTKEFPMEGISKNWYLYAGRMLIYSTSIGLDCTAKDIEELWLLRSDCTGGINDSHPLTFLQVALLNNNLEARSLVEFASVNPFILRPSYITKSDELLLYRELMIECQNNSVKYAQEVLKLKKEAESSVQEEMKQRGAHEKGKLQKA